MSARSAVVAAEFNASVSALLRKIEKKSRSELEIASLDRLKKRILLLKREGGDDALILNAASVFIEYKDHILEKDPTKRDDFFLKLDVRAEYARKHGAVTKTDEYIFGLIDSVKNHYAKSSEVEKQEIYKIVRSMLDNSIEHRILVLSN